MACDINIKSGIWRETEFAPWDLSKAHILVRPTWHGQRTLYLVSIWFLSGSHFHNSGGQLSWGIKVDLGTRWHRQRFPYRPICNPAKTYLVMVAASCQTFLKGLLRISFQTSFQSWPFLDSYGSFLCCLKLQLHTIFISANKSRCSCTELVPK